MRAMKQIVVAVDGSEGARIALETAVELASGYGATLAAVYARHRSPSFVGSPYAQQTLSEELRKAHAALAQATAVAERAGATIETEDLEGDPADVILEFARNRSAGLIVVGSRGLGTVAGALLGSVSSKVVHHADRPVLVARRPPA